EQRSAFNQYFVEGWRGAADSSSAPDELLSLGEWFAFTRERTSAWVWSASGKTSQQTPVLLQAGVGRIEPTAAEQFILRRLPAKQVAKETKVDEKKEQASAWRIPQRLSLTLAQVAPDSTETKKTAAEEPKAAPPLPMPVKVEPPPATPAIAPPADDQSTAALAAIHDARQRLESQWFGANAFTPADFAPHVWRELERRSAGYERAALANSATNDAKEGQRRAARLLVEFQNAEQALNEQRALWDKSARLAILTKHPDLQAAVIARDKATLELHELLRLAFYRPTDGWPAGHLSRLKELQSRTLTLDKALAHTLARDDSGRLTTTSSSPDVSVERVTELATAVEQLRHELHTTSVHPRSDAALANQLLNELLHSSLLNADERRDARAAWRARNQQLPRFAATDLRAPTTSDVESWRTKRAEQIRQAAALEIDFAQVLAAELPAAARQGLAGCGELPALDAAGLQKLNHCGHSLQLFYQQVASQINELAGVPTLTPTDVARLERLIRWQCDTTSASIAAAWANVLRSGTYEIQTAPQRLSIQGPIGVEATSSDGSVPIVSAGGNFTWQIGPAAQLLPETVLQIEYDDKLLVVEQAGGRALPPRSAITVKAADKNSSDLVPIVLRIAPRPGEESGKTATLSMRAVGDKQLALTTTFQLPEPKWLDLFVKGWPGTVADLTPSNAPADAEGLLTWQSATRSNGQSKLLLQPFPSHSSPFELKLGNRSQKVRKITYRVWTVPADKQRSRQRGWKPWEANGELVREAEQLSEQQLEIPAAGSIDLALFPQPKPPMPATPGAPPAPPAAPMPIPPAALLHAERGILCEFVSTDGFAPPQRLWLDVAPLHPSQYVEVGFAPNLAQRSIAAKVSLIPNGPHRWPTHDCDVRWEKLDTADPLKPAGRADTRDLLKNPLTISEQLPPGKESANVVLSIDGYPRAMEYLAPLFGKAERIQSRRSYLRLILLTQDKEQKPVTITERTRYFQTLDKIDYWVQADVPPTGSGAEDYLFRVHVVQASDAGEQGEDTAREYLADRDFTVELSKDQTAAGRFWLRSRVDDLRGTLKLAGLTNRVVT
ncbi:MAG TPA: hypothetical protein VL096_18715, partial [Pirellulaceae bacterium]|nr:hypothetical protein [Pirellulaceae bacterium]